jgi:hypothetical protein
VTSAVDLEGYAEVRASWQFGVDGTPWNLTERARPTFKLPVGDRITVETTVEAAFTEGRDTTDEAADLILDSDVGDLLTLAGCTYTPEARYASASDYLSVERLHVDLNLPDADLAIGRQALNWGSGLVFHPTDLFAEVVATEPWRERRGVNAVKATFPIGEHQVIGVVAVGDDLSPLFAEPSELPIAAAVKATIRAGGTDVSLVGQARTDEGAADPDADFRGDWFAGADLRGNLGVGWWVEGGWHGKSESAEIVAGVDYSFDVLQLLYVAAEYRYDGSGARPEDYDYSARSTGVSMPFDCAFLPNDTAEARTTLGIHYVDATARLGVTEDINVSGVVIANVLDGTGILVPNASFLVGTHTSLNVGAQIPFGKDGEYHPSAERLQYTVGTATADLSGLLPTATALAWARYAF